MDILQAPNPILNRPTKRVKKIDNRIKKIASEMIAIMQSQTDPEGVGIAANQVGIDLSIFVAKYDETKPALVCINPKIIKLVTSNPSTSLRAGQKPVTRKKRARLEGCLSIKNVWGKLDRADKVLLAWTDLEGKKHQKWFAEFASTVIQHECDHLQGMLFTQRVLSQGKKLYKEVDGELEEYEI